MPTVWFLPQQTLLIPYPYADQSMSKLVMTFKYNPIHFVGLVALVLFGVHSAAKMSAVDDLAPYGCRTC
jgi:hypothetical protein